MQKIALASVGWLNYPNATVQFRGVFSTDGHNGNVYKISAFNIFCD